MGEIKDAMKRLDDRKQAVLGMSFAEDPRSAGLVRGDVETQIRALASGLDLDLEELESCGDRAVEVFLNVIANGHNPLLTVKGIWLDTLIMGILLAEARG